MSFCLFVSLSSCLRCENKDLFRRILGILLCQANLQPTKILLCQGNLQHQRQPKSPRSEYFSSTLANFQKYSRYLKTNQLSIYFQRYLHLISHTFVLPQYQPIVQTIRSLAIVGNWIRLLGISAPLQTGGCLMSCKSTKFHLLSNSAKFLES